LILIPAGKKAKLTLSRGPEDKGAGGAHARVSASLFQKHSSSSLRANHYLSVLGAKERGPQFIQTMSSCPKKKTVETTLTKMYWLLGRKSKLSTNNKLLLYKTILKQIWTYRVQLWGTASTSNIEILESFQSKALRMTVDTIC
jgi:hypothetical protein